MDFFFVVHSTIGSTVHSMPLNSLEYCICTTTMTNRRILCGINFTLYNVTMLSLQSGFV